MQKAIAYLRVSTQQQERSGLGLEAQRKMINDFAKNYGYVLIDEYSETKSAPKIMSSAWRLFWPSAENVMRRSLLPSLID